MVGKIEGLRTWSAKYPYELFSEEEVVKLMESNIFHVKLHGKQYTNLADIPVMSIPKLLVKVDTNLIPKIEIRDNKIRVGREEDEIRLTDLFWIPVLGKKISEDSKKELSRLLEEITGIEMGENVKLDLTGLDILKITTDNYTIYVDKNGKILRVDEIREILGRKFTVISPKDKVDWVVVTAEKIVKDFVPEKLLSEGQNEIKYSDTMLTITVEAEIKKKKFIIHIPYNTTSQTVPVMITGKTSLYMYNIINLLVSKNSQYVIESVSNAPIVDLSVALSLKHNTPYNVAFNLTRKTLTLLHQATYIRAMTPEGYIREIRDTLNKRRVPILHRSAIAILDKIIQGLPEGQYKEVLMKYRW